MKIFSGSSNIPLATAVAQKLSLLLAPVETHVFPDGERRVRIGIEVSGEDAVILQSANTPVDSNYMELFFILDGLKRSGAQSITAILPYFGYQRQDHVFRQGEAVSLEVIVTFLESLKIDRFMSFDLHSLRIPSVFTIPVTHLSALPLFEKEIISHHWNDQSTILVSPDIGGVNRTRQMAESLGLPFIALEKSRDLVTGEVSGDTIVMGSITGKKRAIIIDDMVSSGKTIVLAAQNLVRQGIEEVYVFVTHALFSDGAPGILQSSPVTKIFVTDTVFVPENKKLEKLTILSVADIIAKELTS